jgi:hypothetical protein
VVDTLFGQRLHELGLEPGDLPELWEVAQFLRTDVLVWARGVAPTLYE